MASIFPPSTVLDHHCLRSCRHHVGGTDSAGLGLVLLLAGDDGGGVLRANAVPVVVNLAALAEGWRASIAGRGSGSASERRCATG